MRATAVLALTILLNVPVGAQEPIGLDRSNLRALSDVSNSQWRSAFEGLSPRLRSIITDPTTRLLIVHSDNSLEYRHGNPVAGDIFVARRESGRPGDYQRLSKLLSVDRIRGYLATWSNYQSGAHHDRSRYVVALERFESLGIPADLRERVLITLGQDLVEHPELIENDQKLRMAVNTFAAREWQIARNIEAGNFTPDTTNSYADLYSTAIASAGLSFPDTISGGRVVATTITPEVRGYLDLRSANQMDLASPERLRDALASGRVQLFVAPIGERVPLLVPGAAVAATPSVQPASCCM